MISGDQHLDHSGILADLVDNARTQRQAAVEEIELVLAWADLHTESRSSVPLATA